MKKILYSICTDDVTGQTYVYIPFTKENKDWPASGFRKLANKYFKTKVDGLRVAYCHLYMVNNQRKIEFSRDFIMPGYTGMVVWKA